ncbi:SLC13 family permease (plasmid) [Sinorhizobium meliloti]|uniref:SLC13 family permease n=1 Tax=Rhizobium meliloti TaxID=382 RepID=UPI000B5A4B98|nr:SLC13 family permease [Sinorhizobium meliloti]ASJ61931.1 SLC13 family permease [Sinorhizobium meliloti]MCK3785008.1 SLC13 family permease [Sinorhizobium meliloti]MCK3791133.1 SLC13 family permease [Sinorhizobium meliloti]MCK3797738.1 SLC13 family permease [Sinorhizobium meliloti]
MSPIGYIAAIVALTVVLFVWNKLPVVLVAMMTALALWVSGVLTIEQAFGGFGDPAVIFIASLFVISAGLEITGVTAWAGQLLIRGAGKESRTRLLLLTMGLVALLTALISVNGAVAALLPVVVVIAVRLKRFSSQLLMPLVFAAHAGSKLALTGSPVNVLVSDAGYEAGVGEFGFFEFGLVGLPLLAGTVAIIILFGRHLLPERNGAAMPADFSRHPKTLVEQYGLESGIHQMRVRATSPFVGAAASSIDLSGAANLQLVAVQDGETGGPLRRAAIAEGDFVLVRGDNDAVARLAADMHLAFREKTDSSSGEDMLFNRRSGLAEVVIPPRSGLIGRKVFPGMVTESGDLIVLAVQRGGNGIDAEGGGGRSGGTTLQAGDTMLLQGTWKALDVHLDDPDVLVVSSPELVRRQAVPMGPGAWQAIVVLIVMVLLLATGIVPPAVAGLLAAGAMILAGIMTIEQTYRAIGWTTVILVGAMMPLSTAMVETGAAKLMAEQLVNLVGDAGPVALLAGLFVMTAVLGQLISNTATALIIIPIGVAAATTMGVSPRPVLMSTSVAAAAAFLTPIATPTNLMVMGPGGYAFSDYWKLGLPLLMWFFVVSVFVVPLIWRF